MWGIDWRILLTATRVWADGGDPYGALSTEFWERGTFAYPPTALTWMWLWLGVESLLAPLSKWLVFLFPSYGGSWVAWVAAQIALWRRAMREANVSQWTLLLWSPVVVHLWFGQTTLPVVCVTWLCALSLERAVAPLRPRSLFLWGLALAWAMTKPQTAFFPTMYIAWMLWADATKRASLKYLLIGIVLGTLALALPPMLRDPQVWAHWLASLGPYSSRAQQAAAWQGWGCLILLPAFWLWQRRFGLGAKSWSVNQAGWAWWLQLGLLPHASLYPSVVLLPMLKPSPSYRTLIGLGISSVCIAPTTGLTLPLFLSGHLLAGYLLATAGSEERARAVPAP